ncbi:hypothetical protein QTH97_22065 [Variovorax sp. J22R24]|uniref:hypothetical protein n=1 Tax=Variovorax gracilis TaxID=3053502 RepID=UPI0025787915|nr:hypothetical protein [Variovorax sp. J22R24]MDM0107650.1 hypothetical protein [Variovorax sp. J22R24]
MLAVVGAVVLTDPPPPAALMRLSTATTQQAAADRPRGTIYWGGAGLDGDYISPQLQALEEAGLRNLYVGFDSSARAYVGPAGMFIDALRAGSTYRFEEQSRTWSIRGMNGGGRQFNLIGYSYGSLLAAQTANYYASIGHDIDHLVLIGSPIDVDFLHALQRNRHIRKVVVINLAEHGDPIYAGMSSWELVKATPILVDQMRRGEGHFYYAAIAGDSETRWKTLAGRVFTEGLR